MKVFIVGGNDSYKKMFLNRGWEIAISTRGVDLIQFTGGADVNPALYGQKVHPATRFNEKRDTTEQWVYNKYVGKTPMAGICRGAQFLWVMNGGSLFQHVSNHTEGHWIRKFGADDSPFIEVTSTHHQMMRDHHESVDNIIAWADVAGRKEIMKDGKPSGNEGDVIDIEVAQFPDTKCLCFQPHPEHGEGDCQDYYFQLIEEHLLSTE